jgi:hypothetical protein
LSRWVPRGKRIFDAAIDNGTESKDTPYHQSKRIEAEDVGTGIAHAAVRGDAGEIGVDIDRKCSARKSAQYGGGNKKIYKALSHVI